jgi:elongator complex protein 1
VNFYDGPANDTADIPDNVSLAASNISTSASLFTRYTARTSSTLSSQTTHRTSKHRKREERKRARGKKGSVYEEGYLVNSIGRLIERVNSTSNEVKRLVEGLYRRNMREQARAVDIAMEEVVRLCRECVGEVFEVKEEETDEAQLKEFDGISGGDRVLLEEMAELEKIRKAPVVLEFERLSLLGQ